MLGDIGDTRLIPVLGSSPAKGRGNPLQYSCLGNSMDRWVWQATVLGITNNWTSLSTHTVYNHPHHYLPPHHFMNFYPIVVQSLSHVWLFSTPWTEARQDPSDFVPIPCLVNWRCYLSISYSTSIFSFYLQFFWCRHQGLFQWVSSLRQVANILEV